MITLLLSVIFTKMKAKDLFIGLYLDKKMKNHNFSYGFAYFNLLAKMEKKAQKKWKKFKRNKL